MINWKSKIDNNCERIFSEWLEKEKNRANQPLASIDQSSSYRNAARR